MDAPLCKLCEKRHYGSCAQAITPSEPRARKSAKSLRSEKKSSEPDIPSFNDLWRRLESLEARVEKLESRKKYQRDLMRRRRAEGKGDG